MPIDAKLLKTGILALSLTVTATVGLAADYEIFSDFAPVETGANHYAAERLDHKNKKLHHCTAVLDAKTEQLSGECTERLGFRRVRPVKDQPCGEGCQTGLADYPCSAPGKSTKQREKLNSVFQKLVGAWR